MSKVKIFKYKDQEIGFDFSRGKQLINATQMEKSFDKRSKDFLRLQSTKEYIEVLENYLKDAHMIKDSTEVLTVRKGGAASEQGTWMHRLLAVRFAQWLNPYFALWVDTKIYELFMRGRTNLHNVEKVYFLRAPLANLVKIGRSMDIEKRMKAIQVNNGEHLELMKVIAPLEPVAYEKRLHRRFRAYRQRGEWFRLESDLEHFINQLEDYNTNDTDNPGAAVLHKDNYQSQSFRIEWRRRKLLLPIKDIAYIHSEKGSFRTKVYSVQGRVFQHREPIRNVEKILPEEYFFRANVRLIVSEKGIKRFETRYEGSCKLRLSPEQSAVEADAYIAPKEFFKFKQWATKYTDLPIEKL